MSSLLTMVIVVVSCGRSRRHGIEPTDPEVISAPDVQSYKLYDPVCQTSQSPAARLESATLDLWNDGALGPVSRNLSPLEIQLPALAGRTTTAALTGSVFTRNCDTTLSGPLDCLNNKHQLQRFSLKTAGQPIRVCQTNAAPPKNSLEQIALATIEAIESTALSLRGKLPAGTNIEPITILVMPRFESLWQAWTSKGGTTGYQTLLADNLAYFPATSETPPYIAVFPKQKRDQETVNLWESEFVIAHEFAHHVERSLGLDHFDQDRSKIRRAVSEGFADILAFASHATSNRALKGIPCIDHDRAPNELEFHSGAPKIIDTTLLNLLNQASDNHALSAFSRGTAETCGGVSPHSAHGFGAIFAHWVWELASYTPGYRENPGRVLTQVSINWLTRAEELVHAGSDDTQSDLEKVATALQDAIDNQFRAAGQPVAQNVRELLRQKMNLAFASLGERVWFPE